MKKLSLILSGLILSGFVLGRIAGGLGGGGVVEEPATDRITKTKSERERIPASRSGKDFQIPRMESSETLETITAKGANISMGDLALWMVGANAEEIAAYWASSSGTIPNPLKRMVMVNWTREDPAAAIAATAGTVDAELAFDTWAMNDPEAALAAVGPDHIKRVVRMIGEAHPAWLMEHFEELPEELRSMAITGLTTWKETDDPQAVLDFLMEREQGFQSHIFKNFARKDPWAAYDWLEKKGLLELSEYRQGGIEILLREMKSTSPDDLERMAAMAPAGILKRKMEDAAFESLVENDPDHAYQSAKNTEASLISAKRMSMIAAGYLDTEPEKAFVIAGEILSKAGDGLSPNKEITVADNRSSWGRDEGEAAALFKSLMAKDPSRTLDLAVKAAADKPGETFGFLTTTWAETDLPAYAKWVNVQSEPAIKKVAIDRVVNSLAESGSFREAADWAVSSPDATQSLQSLAWRWGRSDPAGAREWFDAADIPQKQKQQLLNQIRNP